MNQVESYIKSNTERYLNELFDYLRIPSVSAVSKHKKDMHKCADFVVKHLKKAGMKKVRKISTDFHPLVYGEWMGAKGKPTVLIYGHYDVQPEDPIEKWKSPPFEPEIRSGKIWARGANDNKGQNFVHFKSVEAFFNTGGQPPVNIKFILEGEEEVGSDSLAEFLKKNKELLKCDAVLISDTSLYGKNLPTINYGLRGLSYMEIEMTGPNKDLHSGSFGGSVANPINELAKLISKLHRSDGKITIPNFYKDVVKLSKKEKENFKRLKFSEKEYKKELGVKELQGEKGYSTLERLWSRPTLDCNGIVGGYIEEGAKTVLPSKASAKISMRLVPNQDPVKIANEFKKYVKKLAPKSVKVNARYVHGGHPIVFPLNEKAIQAAAKATARAFGKKTVFTREGGSIPIVVDFSKILKAPTVLMGLGLDSDNIHSPNEHFDVSSFKKGILSSAYFFEEFAK